jgi:hypothetical protein
MTAATSKTHVFPGVTLQALTSLRDQAALPGQAGGNYALQLDPDGVGGLLTTHTGMGDVVVRFSHNDERAELTVTIVKKPMFLPAAAIFAGTSQVLRNAASQASPPDAKSGSGD